MFSRDDEAIVALCTPRGHGAIALIRISGAGNAIAIVDSCAELSSGKKLESVPTHTIHHGFIVDSGKNIDEVLFLLTKAPKTFTGQDTVEITSHNNPFIIDKIIERLLQCGARVAGRGEFTKRAFLNGKVDLSQAEAVHELICAKSEAAVGSALAQLRGGLSHEMAELEKQILRLVTFAEASFEFGEEEISDVGHDEELRSTFKELSEHVHKIQETFSCQRCVRDGVRVAIVGSVNAGKSTILNSLVGRERAIVSPEAGTTRDTVEATIIQDGVFVTLVDTAGLRDGAGEIEAEGIRRSFEEAEAADIVLVIADSSRACSAQEISVYSDLVDRHSHKAIFVLSKFDIKNTEFKIPGFENSLEISATSGDGIEKLKAELCEKVRVCLDGSQETPFLLNERHRNIVERIAKKLGTLGTFFGEDIRYEIIAHCCRELLEEVACITGKNVGDRVIDQVFSTFCVGK